jgi:hypothetical protein
MLRSLLQVSLSSVLKKPVQCRWWPKWIERRLGRASKIWLFAPKQWTAYSRVQNGAETRFRFRLYCFGSSRHLLAGFKFFIFSSLYLVFSYTLMLEAPFDGLVARITTHLVHYKPEKKKGGDITCAADVHSLLTCIISWSCRPMFSLFLKYCACLKYEIFGVLEQEYELLCHLIQASLRKTRTGDKEMQCKPERSEKSVSAPFCTLHANQYTFLPISGGWENSEILIKRSSSHLYIAWRL